MKTQKNTTAKMINIFDKELQRLLMSDLSAIRSKANLVGEIQRQLNNRTYAA